MRYLGGVIGALLSLLAAVAAHAQTAPFASLPVCAAGSSGAQAYVTDSTTTSQGATITGGSSNHVMAFCNGTNWVVGTNRSVNVLSSAAGFSSPGFSVNGSGAITATSCAGCGVGGGSGTVNAGTAGQQAWYATSTTAVSGNAVATLDSSGNSHANRFDATGSSGNAFQSTGFSVSNTGALTVLSCTGCGAGGGGSGTVNAGTAGQLAWYATSTTAVSGNANATIDSSGRITSANQMALLNTYTTNGSNASLVSGSDITGTYTYYLIYLDGIVDATEDQLVLQLSANGGSTFVQSGYFSSILISSNNTTLANPANTTSGVALTGISGGASLNTTAGWGLSGVLYLFDPLSTSKAHYIHGHTTWMCCGALAPGASGLDNALVYGVHNDTTTGYNAFRITTLGGALLRAGGTMRIYGIK